MSGPLQITGGCNCESIRYTVTFPADYVWPLEANGTCQCTICRKSTGCLLPQTIEVPVSSISPPLSSSTTFKKYRSSSKGERGFCTECGSSINFQYLEGPESTELYLGTIDEDVLLGKKTGEENTGEFGPRTVREGGFGTLLCSTVRSRNIWWENAIPGVTDDRPGLKYWREVADAVRFEKDDATKTAQKTNE